MKEKYGKIDKDKNAEMAKKYKYTTAQLLDENLKNEGGESRKEVAERMNNALNKILDKYYGKRVAIVSHGAAIKYLLMKWCIFNENQKVEYNGVEIQLNPPSALELVFDKNNLISLRPIFE